MNRNQTIRSHTYRIVIDALFAAMFMVVATVWPFTLKLSIVELSFLVTVPIFFTAYLFSIEDAVCVALVGTFVEQLTGKYGLTATTPLWMAPTVLQAVFFGVCLWLLRKNGKIGKQKLSVPVCLTIVGGELLLTVMNTLALQIDAKIGHYNVKLFVLSAILIKLLNCVIRATATTAFAYFLLPRLKNLIRNKGFN